MQNLEKVLIHGAKDLRHGDVYLRLGLIAEAPAESVPRRLVSANLENASRIRAFGSVRIFGHNGAEFWHRTGWAGRV